MLRLVLYISYVDMDVLEYESCEKKKNTETYNFTCTRDLLKNLRIQEFWNNFGGSDSLKVSFWKLHY